MHHEQHGRHLRAYLWLLVVIAALAALAYFFHIGSPAGSTMGSTQPAFAPTGSASSGSTQPNIPAPTPQDMVTAQHGFQYLVQYTATGFHPQSLTVKKGETVRFTNNASGPTIISGAQRTSSTLAHGQYWEFTAATAGTFTFTSAGTSMTITAQ